MRIIVLLGSLCLCSCVGDYLENPPPDSRLVVNVFDNGAGGVSVNTFIDGGDCISVSGDTNVLLNGRAPQSDGRSFGGCNANFSWTVAQTGLNDELTFLMNNGRTSMRAVFTATEVLVCEFPDCVLEGGF